MVYMMNIEWYARTINKLRVLTVGTYNYPPLFDSYNILHMDGIYVIVYNGKIVNGLFDVCICIPCNGNMINPDIPKIQNISDILHDKIGSRWKSIKRVVIIPDDYIISMDRFDLYKTLHIYFIHESNLEMIYDYIL